MTFKSGLGWKASLLAELKLESFQDPSPLWLVQKLADSLAEKKLVVRSY